MTLANAQTKITPFDEHFGTIVEASGPVELADLDRDEMIQLFKKSGLLYFRGFHASVEQFDEFTSRFSTDFMSLVGGGYKRRVINEDGDKSIQSVNYDVGLEHQGLFPLPLHGEQYYLEHRPVMLWFYCVCPAAEDGETTVCDGYQLYAGLSDEVRNLFEKQRIKYIRVYYPADWQKRFQTDSLDVVEQFCRDNDMELQIDRAQGIVYTETLYPASTTCPYTGRPVFINSMLPVLWQEGNGKVTSLVRLEDGSKIPDAVVKEITEVAARWTRNIPWQKGDLALVDNRRVMHGRNSFKDNARELYSRMVRSIDW